MIFVKNSSPNRRAHTMMVLIVSFLHSSVVAFSIIPYNLKGYKASFQSLRSETCLYESSSFDENFVNMQKKVGENDTKTTSIESHLRHQKQVFDDMSPFFNSEEAIPEEVKPVLRFLAKKILSQMKTSRDNEDGKYDLLDVGCGTGALFPYYLEAADELEIKLNIFGLDLSPKMIEYAKENGSNIIATSDNSGHSIQCKTGDFVESVMGVKCCKEILTGFDDGVLDETTSYFRGNFDAVVINACFGNFLDPDSVVTAAAKSLKDEGSFVISHPLGSQFVEKLSIENPSTVPYLLPTESRFDELLYFQPLVKIDIAKESSEPTIDEDGKAIYCVTSKKVPHVMLRQIIRLRGTVDQGYGRGGKKLGFPTANLPSSLFSNALADVPTGVYIGWAVIERSVNENISMKGRNEVHKVVVNVGISPTFEGKENKEKIVEGHLIVGADDIEGDFYGETMRLALCGFLRPEKRFPSFPDLIAAITNDVSNAKKFLDISPYTQFKKDSFLHIPADEKWVGSSGGDDNASYEFESTTNFMEKKVE